MHIFRSERTKFIYTIKKASTKKKKNKKKTSNDVRRSKRQTHSFTHEAKSKSVVILTK